MGRGTSSPSLGKLSAIVFIASTILTRCRPPGSGKSTVVEPLLRRVNQLLSETTDIGETDGTLKEAAICVSLDGWHLYRHELDAMPDPELAHWRRVSYTFP